MANQTAYQVSYPVASVLLIKEEARKSGLVQAKVEVKAEAAKEEISETE
jgi:hypothetical protein